MVHLSVSFLYSTSDTHRSASVYFTWVKSLFSVYCICFINTFVYIFVSAFFFPLPDNHEGRNLSGWIFACSLVILVTSGLIFFLLLFSPNGGLNLAVLSASIFYPLCCFSLEILLFLAEASSGARWLGAGMIVLPSIANICCYVYGYFTFSRLSSGYDYEPTAQQDLDSPVSDAIESEEQDDGPLARAYRSRLDREQTRIYLAELESSDLSEDPVVGETVPLLAPVSNA
jgi:hypothetical protein